MAQMGILVDREDGSRFSLNYNKETTKDLFRYARAERLFREGEKLRWCYESEYEDFYQKNMEEKEGPSRRQRRRINPDFVVEERTKLIDLGLSPGKCIARNTTCAILFARRENVISEQLRNFIDPIKYFFSYLPPNFFLRKSENYNLLQINLSERRKKGSFVNKDESHFNLKTIVFHSNALPLRGSQFKFFNQNDIILGSH